MSPVQRPWICLLLTAFLHLAVAATVPAQTAAEVFRQAVEADPRTKVPIPAHLQLSEAGQYYYANLLTAKEFCDTAVGIAGTMPEVVKAFRHMTREKDPAAIFQALLKDATPPGKLYALCGLYHADHAAFRNAVEPYRKSREKVEFFSGCILSERTMGDIVEMDLPGTVRLDRPNQTTKEWAAKHAPKEGMHYDILGGGWPNVFWERTGY